MLLWLINPPIPPAAPAPDSRLDMLDMLDIEPPPIRAARGPRLGLAESRPLVPPKKGLPILGMEAGTSLIISNPWSSFLVFSRLWPPATRGTLESEQANSLRETDRLIQHPSFRNRLRTLFRYLYWRLLLCRHQIHPQWLWTGLFGHWQTEFSELQSYLDPRNQNRCHQSLRCPRNPHLRHISFCSRPKTQQVSAIFRNANTRGQGNVLCSEV